MNRVFLLTVQDHTASAKNKGIVYAGNNAHKSSQKAYAVNAKDAHEAYVKVCKAHRPEDSRPLSGRTYVKPLKIGDAVRVPKGYCIGYNEDGTRKLATMGHVSEIISDNAVSIEFSGYHTRFVDFGLSELAERVF